MNYDVSPITPTVPYSLNTLPPTTPTVHITLPTLGEGNAVSEAEESTNGERQSIINPQCKY